MATEFGLEDACIKLAEGDGWLVRKVSYQGRASAPDRWFLKNGRWKIVEFKKNDEEPTLLQKREHNRLRKHGQEVLVIRTVEEFRHAFGIT